MTPPPHEMAKGADGASTCAADALWRQLDAEVLARPGATTIGDLL